MALGRWMFDGFEGIPTEKLWFQVDGHRMHCLKAGVGPDLILLHGLIGTASAWDPVIPHLAEESTIYAVDALGIGESDRVAGLDATLEAQADRLVALMDQLRIDSADFLGTSHGGAVALSLAAKYPGRVKNLVLHAPANPFSDLGDPLISFYLSGLGNWFAHRVPTLPAPMQSLALGRMYGDPTQLRNGSLGKYIGSLRVPGTVNHILSILRTWFADMAKLKTELEHVRQFPTLLLWGDRDRAVSMESGQRLRRYFDRVEFQILPGAGHLPYEECPETLSLLVNSFLTRMREAGPQLVRSQARLA